MSRKLSRKLLAATFVASTMLAAPAFAQDASKIVAEQTQNQWRASKLSGVDIYGTDNVKIGDVSDVLLDEKGTAQAVVIGVGGFLGIGQKNVAVPFSAIQWKHEAMTTASTTAPAAPTSTGSTTGTGGSAATAPAPAAPKTAADSASRGYPDHGVLAMTKDELTKAPDFKYYGATASSSSSTTSAPATSGTGMSSPMGGGAQPPKQ